MLASALINHSIPHLQSTDSVADALDKLAELELQEMPVLSTGAFIGIVSEHKLQDVPDDAMLLGSIPLDAKNAYIYEDQHYFDAFRVCANTGHMLCGICSEDNRYLGVVSLTDVGRFFSKSYSIEVQGATIILSMLERDYSLAQLSRLIEAEGVKILSTFLEIDNTDNRKLFCTLKLNRTDASRVIATLERFGYLVTQKFHKSETPDLDQDRLGSLLKYLSI